MRAITRRYQRGSLRLEGHTWILRWRTDEYGAGHRRRLALRVGPVSAFRSKAAARFEADRLLALRGLAPRLEGSRILFKAFAEQYLRAHVDGVCRKSSARAFGGRLNKHLLPHLGDMPLDAIDVAAVQRFVAALGRTQLAVATIRGTVKLLRQMLKTAHSEGFAVSPIGPWTIRYPKDSRPARMPRCFSPAESRQIIDAADGWLKAYCAIGAYTGARAGEILGLEWRHCDFANNRLLIRQAAVDGQLFAPKTASSIADLAMSEPLRAILQVYRTQWHHGTELLFPGKDGRPRGAGGIRRRHLTPLLKRLGLPHGALHGFRHGMASALFAEGVGAPTVMSMMRHGSLRTTMKYSHSSLELQRRGSDAVAMRISTPEETPPAHV